MGENTLHGYFYKPSLGAEGTVEKGKFDDKLDIADAQIEANKSPLVNMIRCSDYDHPDDAIDAIGASNKTLLVTEAEICDTNFTVPANVMVRFERGGKWTINTGVTVTFNGQIDAELWQIFEYTGTGTLAGTPQVREIYPQWWGAKGDGITDDYTAIKNAIAIANSSNNKLFFSVAGTYMVSEKLTISDKIIIDAVNGVYLKASAVMDYIIGNTQATYGTQQLGISNLRLNGNSLAVNCISLYKISYKHFPALDGIYAENATDDGILLRACQGGDFYNLHLGNNAGNGISVQGCNGAAFYGVKSYGNTLAGIEITNFFEDPATYAGGCSFYNASSESNSQDGIHIFDAYEIQILGGWCEGNTRDGIRITDSLCSISGMRISGTGTGSNAAVHITSGGGVYVVGNQFDYVTDISYKKVLDDSGAEDNVISPNYNYIGHLLQIHPYLKVDQLTTKAITGNAITGAAGQIVGGTAVACAASGGTDTFVLTVITSGGANVALELELIGRLPSYSYGFYKKVFTYCAVGSGILYDAGVTLDIDIGDTRKANITIGTPTAVAGQPHFTVTFTNTHAADAFSGYLRVVSYSTHGVTFSVANNQ